MLHSKVISGRSKKSTINYARHCIIFLDTRAKSIYGVKFANLGTKKIHRYPTGNCLVKKGSDKKRLRIGTASNLKRSRYGFKLVEFLDTKVR